MTSIIVLLCLIAIFSSTLVLTQMTTETAVLHIADDAFGGTHHDGATFFGRADISGSVTEYTVDCTADMHGCSKFDDGQSTSFYFSEVSGTTTYTIDSGPNTGIVACGPSFASYSAVCTRIITDSGGNSVSDTSSTDIGYYRVFLSSLPDNVAQSIGATIASVTPSIMTQISTASPIPSPTTQVVVQTSSTTTSASTSTSTRAGDSSGGDGGLNHSGEIGVGVGVALGAVFAAAVALFGWKKWRARRSPEYSPPELYFGNVEQGGMGVTGGGGGAGGAGNGMEMTKGGFR